MVAPIVAASLIAGGTTLASKLLGPKGDPGRRFNEEALRQFQGIDTPDLEELRVQLEKLVYQGDLTPEQANSILQDPSQLNNLDYGTEGREAQLAALDQLQEIMVGGGMTAEDKWALNEIQGRVGSEDRGRRQAIQQNFRERGMGGSGMELVSELMGAQDAATNANSMALDVNAQAQSRALDAITQTGQLGGQVQGQQFGEAARVAEAQDAINRFNAQTKQGIEMYNTESRNAALDRNLQEKQRIADENAKISSDQSKANASATQADYDNRLAKAAGASGQFQNMAAGEREAANAKLGFQGGLLNTAGTVTAGYLASKKKPDQYNIVSDERRKTGIEDAGKEDIMAFLASLDPKTFRYKDGGVAQGESPGENMGVMAQDAEKTPVGRMMVRSGPNGKELDMQKGFGVILAALAALHDKLEEGNHAA